MQWQVQAHAARSQLKVGKDFKPWTSMDSLVFKNVPPTDRVGEILDLAVMQYVGDVRSTQTLLQSGPEKLRAHCSELFTDVSQNPQRNPHTSRKDNVSRCLTTSSCVYSHGLDRLVLPVELLYWQGHQVDVKIPPTLRQRALRDLAGEGMTLPVLASLLYALLLSKSLERALGAGDCR